MQRRYRTALALPIGLMAVAAACGDDDATSGSGAESGTPVIVATTSIWADVTGNVACDGLAEIETVIPIGGDPHSFEPSLQDRNVLETADLVVANGLLLEETLEDTIDAAEQQGTPVFRFADQMTPLETSDADREEDANHEDAADDEADEADHDEEADDEEADDEAGHAHEGGDPHVWFDPVRVTTALTPLRDALVEQAGLNAGAVDACLDEYRSAIEATDAEVAALLDTIPPDRRRLVTNHEALSYFSDHYGFEVLGAVIPAPSTLAEANPADLQELAHLIEEAGVPAIFAESQHSSDDVDALAAAIGDVEVVTLFTDSLGPEGSGAETYLGLLETDAQLIVDALS